MPLDANDQQIIQEALARGGSVWDDATLEPVKRKIKQYYRDNGGEQCCYCRREMRDEFNMVIDIEHVLPKSLFRDFMFELFNLNISCKRCNMRIKKERTDFLVDQATIAANANQSDQYLMVHPTWITIMLTLTTWLTSTIPKRRSSIYKKLPREILPILSLSWKKLR